MEKYTTEERIEYISNRIEFLVQEEPHLLSVIERMINGLINVNDEVINHDDKMPILNNIRIIKNKKALKFIKQLTHVYSMEDLQNK